MAYFKGRMSLDKRSVAGTAETTEEESCGRAGQMSGETSSSKKGSKGTSRVDKPEVVGSTFHKHIT